MSRFEYIRSHNSSAISFSVARNAVFQVKKKPIRFRDKFPFEREDDRCAIHTPVFVEYNNIGCGTIAIGSHPSIQALYDDDLRGYCHVELGARKIDDEFERNLITMDKSFVDAGLALTNKFRARYMAGAPVAFPCYGRGYCYLPLVHPNARHRSARIAGPFPCVRSVVCIVIVCGNWGDVGFKIHVVGENLIHIEEVEWTEETSLRTTLRRLADDFIDYRVGGEFDASRGDAVRVDEPVMSFASRIGMSDVVCRIPGHEEIRTMLDPDGTRALRAISWLRSHGGICSDYVIDCLLVATSANISLALGAVSKVKANVRMWQVLGDVVCKLMVAAYVIDGRGSAEDFSMLTGKGYQCNKTMARAVTKNSMSGFCAALALASDSKGWADILEAVVGVLAMTQPSCVLKKVLTDLTMVPKEPLEKEAEVDDKITSTLTLNSRQWAIVNQMVSEGKL